MLQRYFANLYKDAMSRAYSLAYTHIASSLGSDGRVLDGGAEAGHTFDVLADRYGLVSDQYKGVEVIVATEQ